MPRIPYKRFSVYRREDEMPVILYATAEECAEAMGCSRDTFFTYLSRFKKGMMYPKKYLIYEDEVEEEDGK